jgi:hypothetical protein
MRKREIRSRTTPIRTLPKVAEEIHQRSFEERNRETGKFTVTPLILILPMITWRSIEKEKKRGQALIKKG